MFAAGKLYDKKLYDESIIAYSDILDLQPNNTEALINRASLYTIKKLFHLALTDMKKINTDEVSIRIQENIELQKGNIFYKLGMWKESIASYEAEGSLNVLSAPTIKQKSTNLQVAKKRLIESTTGVYASLSKNSAEYIGPIKIEMITNKGRGIILTKDVIPGELLVVSKAIDIVYLDVKENVLSNIQNILSNNLSKKVAVDPWLNKVFSFMYAGKLQQSISINDLVNHHVETKMPITNLKTIREIVKYNTFGIKGDEKKEMLGIWLTPCFFNHACQANTSVEFFENVLYIKANSFTKKGTELTISYDQTLNFAERSASLSAFNFECVCHLCLESRKTHPTKMFERHRLIQHFNDFLLNRAIKHDVSIIPRLEVLVDNLNLTYEDSVTSKIEMRNIVGFLAILYNVNKMSEKEIQCYQFVLKCNGLHSLDKESKKNRYIWSMLPTLYNIVISLEQLGRKKEASFYKWCFNNCKEATIDPAKQINLDIPLCIRELKIKI